MIIGIIILVFIVNSFVCIYLMSYTKEVNEILNTLDNGDRGGFLSGIDIIEVFKAYRKSEKLSESERKFFKNVLVLTVIAVILIAVFAFLVFRTNW